MAEPYLPTRIKPRGAHTSTPYYPSGTGFIQDLIAAAIDVVFSPFEEILAPLIDPLVDLIGLPDIGFSASVSSKDSQNGMWWCGHAAAYDFDHATRAYRWLGIVGSRCSSGYCSSGMHDELDLSIRKQWHDTFTYGMLLVVLSCRVRMFCPAPLSLE